MSQSAKHEAQFTNRKQQQLDKAAFVGEADAETILVRSIVDREILIWFVTVLPHFSVVWLMWLLQELS